MKQIKLACYTLTIMIVLGRSFWGALLLLNNKFFFDIRLS